MHNLDPTLPLPLSGVALEAAALDLLVHGQNHRPWSEHELALEIGDANAATDAVAGLRAAGLVHRTTDGYIFASRAAIRYHELVGV